MSRLINDWSNETNLLFLRSYFKEPVLWDPRHKHHKEKPYLAEGWERLSNVMQTDIVELKKKRESLMATFRSHVRKKKASINQGATGADVYHPGWFAYELMESFLGTVYDCTTPTNSAYDNYSESSPNSIDATVKPDLDEEVSLTTAEDSGSAPAANEVQSAIKLPAKRRRKAIDAMAEPMAFSGYNTYSPLSHPHMPNVPHENHFSSENDDESDLFCRLLAKKLRKLPETEREMFMYQIDGMFINRMKQMNRPPSPSFSYAVPSPTVQHEVD